MKKIVSFFLAGLLGIFALTSCDLAKDAKKGGEIVLDNIFGTTAETEPSDKLQLVVNRLDAPSNNVAKVASVSDAGVETVEKYASVVSYELTATVLPEDVKDELKLVDWDVFWVKNETESAAHGIDYYASVTPASDGALTAIVDLYHEAKGSVIGVRCTTREGGFVAVCNINYIGVPTDLRIVNGTTDEDMSVFQDTGHSFTIGQKSTHYFDVELSGPFSVDGVRYGKFDVTLTAVGNVAYRSGTASDSWSESFDASSVDWLGDGYFAVSFYQDESFSFVNKKNFEDLVSSFEVNGVYKEYDSLNTHVVFYLMVSEAETGISSFFKFTLSPISGVELSESDIEV